MSVANSFKELLTEFHNIESVLIKFSQTNFCRQHDEKFTELYKKARLKVNVITSIYMVINDYSTDLEIDGLSKCTRIQVKKEKIVY